MAYLANPVSRRVRTNNHVERTNRMFRFLEKVRYKWRRRRTLVRFVVLTLDNIWDEPTTTRGGGDQSVKSHRTEAHGRWHDQTTSGRLKLWWCSARSLVIPGTLLSTRRRHPAQEAEAGTIGSICMICSSETVTSRSKPAPAHQDALIRAPRCCAPPSPAPDGARHTSGHPSKSGGMARRAAFEDDLERLAVAPLEFPGSDGSSFDDLEGDTEHHRLERGCTP